MLVESVKHDRVKETETLNGILSKSVTNSSFATVSLSNLVPSIVTSNLFAEILQHW